MVHGPQPALALIDALASVGDLDSYHPLHSARADLLRRLERFDAAHAAYERALSLTTNRVEQNYIQRRLAETEGKSTARS